MRKDWFAPFGAYDPEKGPKGMRCVICAGHKSGLIHVKDQSICYDCLTEATANLAIMKRQLRQQDMLDRQINEAFDPCE